MILNKWEKCVNNGTLDDIIELYNNDSILISTFGGIYKNDLVGIKDYFQKLRDKSTSVKIITNNVVKIKDNYLEAGIYEFKQGENIIRARFTMVSDDKHIIHHHSSVCN